MVLASKKIHVSEYSPAQIKLTIAGSGKASKKEVLEAVMYSLELKKPPKPDDSACLLYTSPSPRDAHESRMPSSA